MKVMYGVDDWLARCVYNIDSLLAHLMCSLKIDTFSFMIYDAHRIGNVARKYA